MEKKYFGHWGNEVLYRMCRENPTHNDIDVIRGKVWLIGRAYSAAMERQKTGKFSYSKAVEKIQASNIDKWLKSVRRIKRVDYENVYLVLEVHKNVTELFRKITKMEKRSLASKYLHFHQPNAFFIFDSQANSKIRELLRGQRFSVPSGFDKPYTEFVFRCLWYRDNIFEQRLNGSSSPRDLDRFLLGNYSQ